MSLKVIVLNGKRHLYNEESKSSEDFCNELVKFYGSDAIIDFDNAKDCDIKPNSYPK